MRLNCLLLINSLVPISISNLLFRIMSTSLTFLTSTSLYLIANSPLRCNLFTTAFVVLLVRRFVVYNLKSLGFTDRELVSRDRKLPFGGERGKGEGSAGERVLGEGDVLTGTPY